jgi:hypothetical protein
MGAIMLGTAAGALGDGGYLLENERVRFTFDELGRVEPIHNREAGVDYMPVGAEPVSPFVVDAYSAHQAFYIYDYQETQSGGFSQADPRRLDENPGDLVRLKVDPAHPPAVAGLPADQLRVYRVAFPVLGNLCIAGEPESNLLARPYVQNKQQARPYLLRLSRHVRNVPDDPHKTDARIIEKYEIRKSKWARARAKRAGRANVQYIRYKDFFVICATERFHRFKLEKQTELKDIRRELVRFAGHSIGYHRVRDRKFHIPVRNQIAVIVRAVNRARKTVHSLGAS